MSNEETVSVNNMEELMTLMEEEDEHNKGGTTSGGGRVSVVFWRSYTSSRRG